PCPPGVGPLGPHPLDPRKESDVLRRAFMTGGPAALAAPARGDAPARTPRRVGEPEAAAIEDAVRRIRAFDDRFGADGLYTRAAQPLRTAYALLDAGTHRPAVTGRLHRGAGELAISVGWLAHDSGRYPDARSYYAEALATARVAEDRALEAHAFCNLAFLARDTGRPREAVRAAQAGQGAARGLASPRLLSLLALREAGGWAGLGDRVACESALLRAQSLFGQGPTSADPEWMSFYGEAELEGLEAQCWAALGDPRRAAEHARRAVALQDPHFTRNIALFTAELAGDLADGRHPEEAAAVGNRALDLLRQVRSGRIRAMLDGAAGALHPHRSTPAVAEFLARHRAPGLPA
ncbi:tetratricopeptide repeat protein, partial [Streptomyces palmae]